MIEFKNVSKLYNNTKILNNLNFKIEDGEFITIIGSSGSGKTTTLKMINRLIEPTSGEIFFNGENILNQDIISLRRKIGYVIQQIALFPHMNVFENIATVPKLLRWNKEDILDRVKYLLDLVKLPYDQYANRYPNQLSGGQMQRVGVIRALAADPPILLFDEPLTALDSITRNDLQKELQKIHQSLNSKTFIFVTHDIVEALRLATRVMIMDNGEIVQFDTPKNILKNPCSNFVKTLINSVKEQNTIWEELQ